MELREVRYRPDWPSRVLAVFALILAGLALGYVVLQGQVAVTQDALVKQFDQRLTEQSDRRKQELDQLVSALQKSTTEIQQAAANQTAQVESFLTQSATRIESLEKNTSEKLQNQVAEVSNLADLQDERLQRLEDGMNRLTVARPPLPAATDVLLTATGNDSEVEITNQGQEPLVIDAVRFVPTEVVKIDELKLTPPADGKPANSTSTNPEDVQLELVFSKTENSTATSGDHGTYLHKLSSPITIKPGGRAYVRLAINNPQHGTWALIGDLALLQNQTELKQIRSVGAPFIRG